MEPRPGQDRKTQREERVCVACPRCGQGYRVSARVLGRHLVCRHCREKWRAEELRPEDFKSGRLVGPGTDSGSIVLPDELRTPGSSGSRSAAIDTVWAGRTLGRYRVLSILGQGGMGVVWRAHDESLRRDAALKILNRRGEGSSDGGLLNAELFLLEARAIAKLQHPSVVSIFEVAEDQGQVFLALELMEGGTLKEYVDRYGRIPPRELWAMMTQPARAMALAHRLGIIHRDIKPGNMMFDAHGHLKLMDFGLADVARDATSEKMRGKTVGSLGWIAPETARGEGATAASDIYSMGLVMLYALTGRSWLHAHSKAEFMALHKHPPALDLSEIRGLTQKGAAVLRNCLAVERSDRYPSAALLADALQECADEDPFERSRRRKSHAWIAVFAGLIGGLMVAVGAVQWFIHELKREDKTVQPAVIRVTVPTPRPDAQPPAAVDEDAAGSAGSELVIPEEESDTQASDVGASEDLRRPWPEVYPEAGVKFVASKNNPRIFHLATSACGRSIFASNLVVFESLEEAESAGRTLCPKCRRLMDEKRMDEKGSPG
ncbi:MAG: protein kinase [Phycisphaerae bacterium]|nr:protein kinase [Phycisphaerae bacterium]